MARKQVIIIGAGFAGTRAYKLLKGSGMDVKLISSAPFFEYTPNNLRSIVQPSTAAAQIVPLPKKDGIHGTVIAISADSVTLADGRVLPFDYLLIAAGSTYAAPIKPAVTVASIEAHVDSYKAAYDQLAAASSFIVVGGGSVGVEMVGEIVEAFTGDKKKRVTLITNKDMLLERMHPKAGELAAEWLKDHGVNIVHGQQVVSGLPDGSGRATLTTHSGQKFAADLVYNCVGGKPATATFAASLSSDKLALKGGIVVEPTLQVKGLTNVFAAGDIMALPIEKSAAFAGSSAGIAAANIKALAKKGPNAKLQTFPEDAYYGARVQDFTLAGGLISLGPDCAVMGPPDGGEPTGSKGNAGMKAWFGNAYIKVVRGSWLWGMLIPMMTGMMAKQVGQAAVKRAQTAAVA